MKVVRSEGYNDMFELCTKVRPIRTWSVRKECSAALSVCLLTHTRDCLHKHTGKILRDSETIIVRGCLADSQTRIRESPISGTTDTLATVCLQLNYVVEESLR